MPTFSDRLRELREARGLSHQALSIYSGVPIANISRYVHEDNDPTLCNLCKLADFFGVSLDYLVGRDSIKAELAHRLEDERDSGLLE